MDQQTFHQFQKACTTGQFSTFLKIAKNLPLADLENPLRQNMWLFYSELLRRAFLEEKTSATKLKSFSKHAENLGQVFLTLPLADHPYWIANAFTGFYRGCQRSGVDTNQSLVDQMITKSLLTPQEQMKELNICDVLALLHICGLAHNPRLHEMGRYFAQCISETSLKRSTPETICTVLPYVSFEITPEHWVQHTGEVRALVDKMANQQQAQRLTRELPDVARGCSRKM